MQILSQTIRKCHGSRKSNGTVEYITDMKRIMEYGVMRMPALVVNEKVVSMGKVLTVADVERLLQGSDF